MDLTQLIVTIVIALAVIFFIGSTIKVIRQQRVGLIERLGKFHRTLEPGPPPPHWLRGCGGCRSAWPSSSRSAACFCCARR